MGATASSKPLLLPQPPDTPQPLDAASAAPPAPGRSPVLLDACVPWALSAGLGLAWSCTQSFRQQWSEACGVSFRFFLESAWRWYGEGSV